MYYGNFIKWVWKITWNSSKTAPNPASFKVEHDFLKTVLPMVILKWISQPSNCLAFSKWLGLLDWLAKLARLLVFDFEQLLSYFLQDDISFYFLVDFFEHNFWKKKAPTHVKPWSWAWFSENSPTYGDFEFCLENPKLHQIRDVTNLN